MKAWKMIRKNKKKEQKFRKGKKMSRRAPIDAQLQLTQQTVHFLNGQQGIARVEGNNAAWHCHCGELLIGRCYYQFGDTCHTVCPRCNAKYRVIPDMNKKVKEVREYQ